MTAADEYQRVAARVMCQAIHPTYLLAPCSTCRRAAQALATDPGVREAAEREARAEAWDEGHDAATDVAEKWYGAWDNTDNPYRQEPSDG